VSDSSWRDSSLGVAEGVNGGLVGLFVDFNADDLDTSSLYQIVSNTANTLIVETADDLSLTVTIGDNLVGVHQFTTLNILGGASVDFGDDRLLISDLTNSQVSSGSEMFVEQLTQGVLDFVKAGSGTIHIADTSSIVDLDLTGFGTGNLTLAGGLTLSSLTMVNGGDLTVNGALDVSGMIQVSGNSELVADELLVGNLDVSGGGIIVSGTVTATGDVTFSNNFESTVAINALVAENLTILGTTLVADILTISQNINLMQTAVLTVPYATAGSTVVHELDITAGGVVYIDEGSMIYPDGKGYNAAIGFNKGSYGGQNRDEANDTVYGHYVQAILAGASGSVPGGGILNLIASTLNLDGEITANGDGNYWWAGAGGGIHIDVDTLSVGDFSLIQANGGPGTSRPAGAGGRISLYVGNLSEFEIDALADHTMAASHLLGPTSGSGTIFIQNKAPIETDLEKHLYVLAIEQTLDRSTPIVRVGQHSIIGATVDSNTWTIQVSDSSWTASSVGIPMGVNGGLVGLYVDFDMSDDNTDNLYEIISNTDNSIDVQTTDDLSIYVSKNLVGVHSLNSLVVQGGASVDFGSDRVLVTEENGYVVDGISSVFADEVIMGWQSSGFSGTAYIGRWNTSDIEKRQRLLTQIYWCYKRIGQF